MTNYEKYKEELIKHLVDGKHISVIKKNEKVASCGQTLCRECLFYDETGSCSNETEKWLNEEATLDILDEVEKEYLGNLIKPFKKDVHSVRKYTQANQYYISIRCLKSCDSFNLPYFKNNSYYKGMVLNRNYTLEELGLD